MTTQYTIQGRTVSIPVEIRRARSWFATFAVPFAAARNLVAYSGLVPASPLPGRAFCSLAFVDYADGDLDPYHEFAVAILVCEPGSAGRKPAGAFIHQLPVDQSFTCEAGREMWGFPKFIADIEIRSGARGKGQCTLATRRCARVDAQCRRRPPRAVTRHRARRVLVPRRRAATHPVEPRRGRFAHAARWRASRAGGSPDRQGAAQPGSAAARADERIAPRCPNGVRRGRDSVMS